MLLQVLNRGLHLRSLDLLIQSSLCRGVLEAKTSESSRCTSSSHNPRLLLLYSLSYDLISDPVLSFLLSSVVHGKALCLLHFQASLATELGELLALTVRRSAVLLAIFSFGKYLWTFSAWELLPILLFDSPPSVDVVKFDVGPPVLS